MTRKNAQRKFWVGVGVLTAASALYGWRGIHSTLDLIWHGGMFVVGIALLFPAHYYDYALATVQSVFGKSRVDPPSQYPPLPGGPEGQFPTGEGK